MGLLGKMVPQEARGWGGRKKLEDVGGRLEVEEHDRTDSNLTVWVLFCVCIRLIMGLYNAGYDHNHWGSA